MYLPFFGVFSLESPSPTGLCSANLVVLAGFLFKHQSVHPSPSAQHSHLPQLYHPEQMTGVDFLYCLQHSFTPHVKASSSKSHSQTAIIDQNGPTRFHSTFGHRQLWPCQVRTMSGFQHPPHVASLHSLSVTLTHVLGFPTTLPRLPRQGHISSQWIC